MIQKSMENASFQKVKSIMKISKT